VKVVNPTVNHADPARDTGRPRDRHVVARIPVADLVPVPIILGEPDYRLFLCCRGPEANRTEHNEN
jgi:hypothetical protein